jgi:hypothetical protein
MPTVKESRPYNMPAEQECNITQAFENNFNKFSEYHKIHTTIHRFRQDITD